MKIPVMIEERSGPECYLFVLWPNAVQHSELVEKQLRSSFGGCRAIEVDWQRERFLEKLQAMYNLSPDKAIERMSVSGYGKLLVYIVQDNHPTYKQLWRFGTGYTLSNDKIHRCKTSIRNSLAHAWLAHSSNDLVEARRDSRLFLNINYDKLSSVIGGADKFEAAKDNKYPGVKAMFDYLNDIDDCLVLRDYSEGDIDVLTRRSPLELSRLLGTRHKRLRALEFTGHTPSIPDLDVVNQYHGIFCPVWCNDMLQTKVFDEHSGVFRPRQDHLLFSVLYHALLHKPQVPPHYQSLVIGLAKSLEYEKLTQSDLSDKKTGLYFLIKFMRLHNYSAPDSLDSKMFVDRKILSELRKALGHSYLEVDPQSNVTTPEKIGDSRLTQSSLSPVNQPTSDNLVDLTRVALNSVKNGAQSDILKMYSRNVHCLQKPLILISRYMFSKNITKTAEPENFIVKIYFLPYEEFRNKILKSLKAAQRLRHPSICSPIQVEVHGSCILSSYKYVDGVNLSDLLGNPDHSLDTDSICRQIHAIQRIINKENLQNGDLYLNNFVADKNGKIYLIDHKYCSEMIDGEGQAIEHAPLKSVPDNDENSAKITVNDVRALGIEGSQLPGSRKPTHFKIYAELSSYLRAEYERYIGYKNPIELEKFRHEFPLGFSSKQNVNNANQVLEQLFSQGSEAEHVNVQEKDYDIGEEFYFKHITNIYRKIESLRQSAP